MTMEDHWDRAYIEQSAMATYATTDRETARRYGITAKAAAISNIDYKLRHQRFQSSRKMQPPPRCGRIFSGYLVVRKLGTPDEYETWMPEHAFDEVYSTR